MKLKITAFILAVCLLVSASACAEKGGQTVDKDVIDPAVQVQPASAVMNSDGTVTMTYTDTDLTLHNPQMGWQILMQIDEVLNYGVPIGYDFVELCASWDRLEPEEGRFDWEKLDLALAKIKTAGVSVELRLYLMQDDVWKYDGVPSWIYDKYNIPFQIVKEVVFPGRDEPIETKHPVYSDQLYQEKMRNFVNAFAAHYKDGDFDMVDMLSYSMYGEWDCGWNPYDWKGDRELKSKTLHQLVQIYIDAFKDFSLTKIVMCISAVNGGKDKYEDYKIETGHDLAMAQPNFGIRYCGVGDYDAVGMPGHLVDEFFPATPVTAETWYGWDPDKYDIDRTLQSFYRYHCNAIAFGMYMGNAELVKASYSDMFKSGLKTMGYRLLPQSLQFPTSVKAGESFTMKSLWSNLGVGVCWRKYPLTLSLQNAKGEVVWTGTDDNFDQTRWVKNQEYAVDSTFTLPADLAKGDYSLMLSLNSHEGRPAISLPIGSDAKLRIYNISKFTVK